MKPFTVISETEDYRFRDRLSVLRARLGTPDGKETEWAYVKQNDVVAVIAFDDDKCIRIKREWRLNRKDFVWELPSGFVEVSDPTEQDILDTANRELQEEVGVKADHLTLLRTFYPSNHISSRYHVVLATGLTESKLPYDEFEFVEAQKVPFGEASEKLLEGQIPTGLVIVALECAKEYLNGKE
ncbi:MAG: NUDIX hydrolase [Candidatus Moranbacteria bacterium]|nr:NUDIX hydrolase [Candidatus Moranbacteria bacterium]NTW89561.1 NUDIX hydrolase [Candidatus Moranbacteria bacterium]